jgi:hypothetical protein
MDRHPSVFSVVQTPDSNWDVVGKGTNTNATRVDAGGAGMLSRNVVQVEKSPKSSSGESSHIG